MWTDLHLPLRRASVGVRAGAEGRSLAWRSHQRCRARASQRLFFMDGKASDGVRCVHSNVRFLEPCRVDAERLPVWTKHVLAFRSICLRVLHLQACRRIHTKPVELRLPPWPRWKVPSDSLFGSSAFCGTRSNLLKDQRSRSSSFSLGISFNGCLQLHVCPLLLRIVSQSLIGRHREHHGCRFAIVSKHTWPAMLFQFCGVLSRAAREVGEADDVLLKNQIHTRILAQNNVLSQTTMSLP